jgi:hypothetical protein
MIEIPGCRPEASLRPYFDTYLDCSFLSGNEETHLLHGRRDVSINGRGLSGFRLAHLLLFTQTKLSTE